MTTTLSRSLHARFARVRLFLCDVDGVLTDGSIFMSGSEEIKLFNIPDGLGLRLLQRSGIRVGWISNRPSPATRRRARDLKIDFLHQAQDNKVPAAEAILARAGVRWDAVCYLGDDIVDLGVLRRAGLAVSVANGLPEARALAHYVTRKAGGRGAVREVAERILKAQKKWKPLVSEYSA
jgi:3-deoxy-D-manno-octulosonate 8-phosphate phosphatase (KDO 8-P phosphatase)